MTDAELRVWWPDLATVVIELRRSGQTAVAGLLVEAARGGATSGEVLGDIGAVLRRHRRHRSALSDGAAGAWDRVMADVYRAFPGARLVDWFARLSRRSR